MERLINKKVSLRCSSRKTALIACSDKESVNHIKFDKRKNSENSLWVIRTETENVDKLVRLESVYGTFLGYSDSDELTVAQIDISTHENGSKWGTWWILDDIDKGGFNCVQLRVGPRGSGVPLPEPVYLCRDPGTSRVVLFKMDLWWRFLWNLLRHLNWEMEVVETAEENNEIASLGYTCKVNQMYNYNLYYSGEVRAPLVPFINYDVNSGRNVNGSGTQTIGGAIVHTQIDKFVNNNIVNQNV